MGLSKQSSLSVHREIRCMDRFFFAIFTMHFLQLMRQGTLKPKSSFSSPAVGAEAIKTERKAYSLAWVPYVYKIATRHTRCHKLQTQVQEKFCLTDFIFCLVQNTPDSFVLWLPRTWSQGVAERHSNYAKDNIWIGDLLEIGPSLHALSFTWKLTLALLWDKLWYNRKMYDLFLLPWIFLLSGPRMGQSLHLGCVSPLCLEGCQSSWFCHQALTLLFPHSENTNCKKILKNNWN